MVDGEVFICGRLKDIIIIRGRNFYPNDIEWVVSELPGVRRGNVVAFGVETSTAKSSSSSPPRRSQARGRGSASAIAAGGHRADFALTPHEVVIVPQGTLPRTSSGKPQRRKTQPDVSWTAHSPAHGPCKRARTDAKMRAQARN